MPLDFKWPEIPCGFRLMFADAVGDVHGFECTMKTALLTMEHNDIRRMIVGDGRRLDWVRELVREYGLDETVVTLGRYPAETMPLFFEQADVVLVTLNDDSLFKHYAPAKISLYMASSRPIIAVMNGEGGEVIKDAKCGWHLAAGDAEGFARLAVELSQTDKSVLQEKGANGLCVPTTDFQVVHQLLHVYGHYVYEGVGLRQIMDLYFAQMACANKTEVSVEYEKYHMRRLGCSRSLD